MDHPDFASHFAAAKQRAVNRLAAWLEARFIEEISEPKWKWTDTELRDIIDTGRLRSSLQVNITSEGITFTWPVDYARDVHDGAVLRGSGKRLPARPWTEAPLAEASERFGEFLQEELERG
ncbi:hypothetical protein IQ216_00135 [Cyanobium sp. LEGE 06143]|uniref:hypothetical protein n=1 Tax=Cyanobium sp. LEGE 06143 TaxID=945727 RepID=UPI001882DFCA|nr:hypothetical protein [Cyanobium sp. LEGE 06143]MBE9171554.1 hypothetical protein [Cyanobium sp. LEGE 06143]